MRLVHSSVHGNHIHLLIEATDNQGLARGMQGLSTRIAKALNRVMRFESAGASAGLRAANVAPERWLAEGLGSGPRAPPKGGVDSRARADATPQARH